MKREEITSIHEDVKKVFGLRETHNRIDNSRDAKQALCYLARLEGYKPNFIAQYMNEDITSVYKLLRAAKKKMTKNKEFRRKVFELS